jgi:penicillin-binding protein 2
MSFHPNDMVRRGRAATVIMCGVVVVLLSAFFKTQIIGNQQYALQAEQNRLREIPLPAPRGVIYDRTGKPIADNVVGYSVALLARSEASLDSTLGKLQGTIEMTKKQHNDAINRYRRDRGRPTVIFPDASFDVVSVLEEHHLDFPNLIIQSSPKRIYPAGKAVGAFVGYIAEINEGEMTQLKEEGYKPGQQIGRQGLEKQYEKQLRGREGVQFVEVDARNRIVPSQRVRPSIAPVAAQPLRTNIDLDLQTFIQGLFGDTLAGGAVALDPKTGGVLAVYSAPGVDPNRWIGGIPPSYYDSLKNDPRRPLFNKALQGTYPPGSTWKLATAVIGLEDSVITFKDHMPQPCAGYYYFGNRAWHCWKNEAGQYSSHGSLDLTGAIAVSCDIYFYQLGLKIGLSRLVAGGLRLGFGARSGIDLPEEYRPQFPNRYPEYFNEKYGSRGWTEALALNMAIGQGEDAQTILNMARFYGALATDGTAAAPRLVAGTPQRVRLFQIGPDAQTQLRAALVGVVSSGTAAASAIAGLKIAGKTGTAQVSGSNLNDAWFVGFAPADDPKIVVAVMLENVKFHGSVTAHMATAIMQRYLHMQVQSLIQTEG